MMSVLDWDFKRLFWKKES